MAFEQNFTAFRYASWGGPQSQDYIVCVGEDLSEAQFAWSFADEPGGEVRILIETAPSGNQGVHASYDPDLIAPDAVLPSGGTNIVPFISQDTIAQLPDPEVHGADIVLHHTLYITPPDGPKRAECFGTFTIKQGAPN
ncbi:hypothetical protein [Novosphingobium mangrovi (ex Hu et al. 2023)]|uniref:Uncharacterized protein n=1 Tax=Novosphingobium mangrovi (ex Hu et al. 2023) TaxID=2930094 RepID=A0ABT0ACC2_9SPHN|nr:hypothetical protein [Novosphingobium mangrovi (ex Hu et al. 2023)]MCJ1960809.1 hypothetical protein [Novosphingobium mangrovi (ex Hu et al. 2023)]